MTYLIKIPKPPSEKHRANLLKAGSNLIHAKPPVYLTHFKILYPNCAEILQKEYNLKKEDLIYVFFMKVIDLPHYKNYRSKFKLWHKGTVQEFHEKIRKHYETNVWPKYRKLMEAKRSGLIIDYLTPRMIKKLEFDINTKEFIHFNRVAPEDREWVKLKVKESMSKRFPYMLENFKWYVNEVLRHKPNTAEYSNFMKNIAYKRDYIKKNTDVSVGVKIYNYFSIIRGKTRK